MRKVVDALCGVMHHLYWVPLLNRLPGWGCPVCWACGCWERFDRWYWGQ